jgi:hypothetical protein
VLPCGPAFLGRGLFSDADGSLILTEPVLEASLDLPARLLVRLLAAGKLSGLSGSTARGRADLPPITPESGLAQAAPALRPQAH